MRCKECGETINSGDRYCDFCGTPVYQKESIYNSEYADFSEEKTSKQSIWESEKVRELFLPTDEEDDREIDDSLDEERKQPKIILHETKEQVKTKHKSSSIIGTVILFLVLSNIFIKSFMPKAYYHSAKGIVGILPTAIWIFIIVKIVKAAKKNKG